MKHRIFEMIEHTGDAGMKAYGTTKEEMFVNAATGMFSIIADLKSIKMQDSIDIEVEADNIEELFVAWLRELLYQCDVKKVIFKAFSIEFLDDKHLRALCYGERINIEKQKLKTEIKAVTYHQLKVWQENSLWIGQIIFDL
ncbi:MAG: archease [Candidatus Omnitrophota bacterium]